MKLGGRNGEARTEGMDGWLGKAREGKGKCKVVAMKLSCEGLWD